MKHTKEPWRVVSDVPVMAIYSEPEDYRVVQTVNQNNFNTYGKSRVDVGIYKQEDAERIVACVNACAGITTEALENGLIKHLLDDKLLKRFGPPVPCPVATYPQLKKEMTYLGNPIFEEGEDGKD